MIATSVSTVPFLGMISTKPSFSSSISPAEMTGPLTPILIESSLARESGITPFRSLAKAIADGDEEAELIQKSAPEDEYSIFLCGSQAMYNFVDQEIEKLSFRKKIYPS